MAISSTAPIARFGRWLDTLSLWDLLVIGAISPVLGLASVIGPAWLAAPVKPHARDLMGYSIEQFDFRSIICLFSSGAVVALLSRRLGVWAASTAMAGYVFWVFSDMVANAPGHNLLPFSWRFTAV